MFYACMTTEQSTKAFVRKEDILESGISMNVRFLMQIKRLHHVKVTTEKYIGESEWSGRR